MPIYLPLTFLVGLFGAYASNYSKDSWFHYVGVILAACSSGAIWLMITDSTKAHLALASVYFDITYTLAYFIGLAIFVSQPINPTQWIGVGIAVIGLVIANH